MALGSCDLSQVEKKINVPKSERNVTTIFTQTLWTGMEILAWFLVGGIYYSHAWFLHTTGLFRYQGPKEKWEKAKTFSKAIAKATATFIELL